MQKSGFYILSGIVFSLFIIFLSFIISNYRTSLQTNAQTGAPAGDFSVQNSYIFASPYSSYADGKSIIRVTIVVLDYQGNQKPGLKTSLMSSGPVDIIAVNEVTDRSGRATFDVTSTKIGDYTINALVSNVSLLFPVSVSFQ